MEGKMAFDRDTTAEAQDRTCEPLGRMYKAKAKVKNTFLQFPVRRVSIQSSSSKSEGGTSSSRESSPGLWCQEDDFDCTHPAADLERGQDDCEDSVAGKRGSCSVASEEENFYSKQSAANMERRRNHSGEDVAADRRGICSQPIEEVGTPIVKNTFIECYISRSDHRRKTLPASLRLSLPECANSSGLESSLAASEACSTSGTDEESPKIEEADDITDDKADNTACSSSHSYRPPRMPEGSAALRTAEHFAKVIKEAASTLESSDLIASVQTSCRSQDCAILLRPRGDGQVSAEEILLLARQALRNAAGKSQVVYALGYCSSNMTAITPLGFEVTLGSMDNAKLACWHMFKKGFCRHGETCRRQHPARTFPVRVLLEAAQLQAPSASIQEFKCKLCSIVSTVTAALQQSPSVSRATFYEDSATEAWTIEVSLSKLAGKHQEDTLGLAKNALLTTTFGSQVALMGHDAQPFVPNSEGFTAVLGNRWTAGKACVKMYAEGVCYRGCSCHFDHPNCLTPIKIAIKPN